MDESLPKYLNSPETPVYNKRKSLYGLHEAKARCRESQTVYVVEGYFDLLALHQHGLRDSVATLGTAVTPDHVKVLRGFVGKNGKLILIYDSDEAGINAAQRSIEVFEKGFVDARILVLPAGYDPDSYLFEFGSESLLNLAEQALGIIPFLIDSAEKKHGLSIEGKIRVISDMRKPLASIHDSVKRSLYIKELAERTGIDEAAIQEKIRETSPGRKGPPEQMAGDKGSRIEKKIVSMMLQFPEILPEIVRRNVVDFFEDGTLKSIGRMILKHGDGSVDLVSDLIAVIEDDDRKRMIASLAIEEEIWSFKECIKLITKFMEISSNQSKKVLMEKIKAAEKENDHDLLAELLYEKQKMAVINEKRKMAILSERMK